jgi:hypothetical protein
LEYEQLSGYDRFILLTEQARGLSASLTVYLEYQKVEKILELCSRSDASTIYWDGKDVQKPCLRAEAEKIITGLSKNKFDSGIFKIARLMKVELRV